ncbi:uncharacterized protein LOC116429697 [Nomia melanderi]|uniref:uncharacterized protein LOC116429697 n=1 Tax=Nomia melanderi TaxID=2448451 RepID=UPI003FCCBC92
MKAKLNGEWLNSDARNAAGSFLTHFKLFWWRQEDEFRRSFTLTVKLPDGVGKVCNVLLKFPRKTNVITSMSTFFSRQGTDIDIWSCPYACNGRNFYRKTNIGKRGFSRRLITNRSR